jgi:hypothetical protein
MSRRHVESPIVRGRLLAPAVAFIAIALPGAVAHAFQFGAPPLAVFQRFPDGVAVDPITLTVFRSGAGSPPGVDVPVTLNLIALGGTSPRTLSATIAGTSGQVTFTPIATSDFRALGNEVTVSGSGEPTSAPVAWYSGTYTWTGGPVTFDVTNGAAGAAQWTIRSGASVQVQDPVHGTRTLAVASGQFDVTYTLTGVDTSTGAISSDTSFLRLSDGTQVAVCNGDAFVNLVSHGPSSATVGVSALGLSGSMNGTVATVTPSAAFSAPSITVGGPGAAVPALGGPGTAAAAALLLVCALFSLRAVGTSARRA